MSAGEKEQVIELHDMHPFPWKIVHQHGLVLAHDKNDQQVAFMGSTCHTIEATADLLVRHMNVQAKLAGCLRSNQLSLALGADHVN